MRRRPLRTTERSDPRSTRRAIAFRLRPVSSAASVIVYVRNPSSLEPWILPNHGAAGNSQPTPGVPHRGHPEGKTGRERGTHSEIGPGEGYAPTGGQDVGSISTVGGSATGTFGA